MFCTKCGSQVPDNQTFCTKCGAKLEENFQAGDKPLPELLGQNNVVKDLISMGLMIICLICTLTKTFKINMLWASEKMNVFELIELEALKPILIVIYICSILALIIPLIKESVNKKIPVIIALGTVCITLILFIVVFCMAMSKANDYGADIGFTFSGIMLILGSIINFILLSLQLRNVRK